MSGDAPHDPAPDQGGGSGDGSGVDDHGARATPERTGEIAEMLEEFDDLEALVDDDEEREQVRAARDEALAAIDSERVFGRVIRGFDRGDVAEAFLGSVLLGIPMLTESGTFEAGTFIASRPAFLAGTVLFGVGTVAGILYVADIQDVRIHEPLLGVVPRRLAGVVTIAAVTAAVLATLWGRVDWATPGVALAQITVAAVPMAVGGALGDILPGT